MSAAAIRAFGVLVFVFEAVILLVSISQRWRIGPWSLGAIISISVFAISATLIGVGLLMLRKWAAVVFSLALIVLPSWFTLDAFGDRPSLLLLSMIAFALVIMLPIIIIIRSWPLLSWGGNGSSEAAT